MKVCRQCRDEIRHREQNLLAEDYGPPHGRALRKNPTRWFTGLEGYPAADGLLTTSSAKTSLGENLGYLSGVLYLLPVGRLEEVMQSQMRAGTVCAAASPGCAGGCLVISGRGGMDSTFLSRARKTWLFKYDKKWFMAALERSIQAIISKAHATFEVTVDGRTVPFVDPITGQQRCFIPCIRLNGTSDIQWEKPQAGIKIMDRFPDTMFYDYTKLQLSKRRNLPPNYHLTFSYSDDPQSAKYALEYLRADMNVAVVWRTLYGVIDVIEKGSWKARGWKKAYPVINGDRDDLRFLDPPGSVVALYAKISGDKAQAQEQRVDPFGFFIERLPEQAAYEGWFPPPPNARDPQSPAPASVWKKRCTSYCLTNYPDPRDPLGGRVIQWQRCNKTQIPYDTQVSANTIRGWKKKWMEETGLPIARELGPQGVAFHRELLATLPTAGFSPLIPTYESDFAAIRDQAGMSDLRPIDTILRTVSHAETQKALKKWLGKHDPALLTKLNKVAKRLGSQAKANVARRAQDKKLREKYLVQGFIAWQGIDTEGLFDQLAEGALPATARVTARKNPDNVLWRSFDALVDRIWVERYEAGAAMPSNPYQLSFGEGAWKAVSMTLNHRGSFRTLWRNIQRDIELFEDLAEEAYQEHEIERAGYFSGTASFFEDLEHYGKKFVQDGRFLKYINTKRG